MVPLLISNPANSMCMDGTNKDLGEIMNPMEVKWGVKQSVRYLVTDGDDDAIRKSSIRWAKKAS